MPRAPRPIAAADQNYLLRGIDPKVWARFRERADADGIPMRAILLQLAAAYADGDIELWPRNTKQGRS